MRTFVSAALLAATAVLIAAPAFAQDAPSAMDIEMQRRKRAAEDADRGYKVIIKNTTPEKATKTDPWANAREPANNNASGKK